MTREDTSPDERRNVFVGRINDPSVLVNRFRNIKHGRNRRNSNPDRGKGQISPRTYADWVC